MKIIVQNELQLPSAIEKARQFGHALPLHLGNLKTIHGAAERRQYIDGVERKHGKEAADRLKQAYLDWWVEWKKS